MNAAGDTLGEAFADALNGLESALSLYVEQRRPIPAGSFDRFNFNPIPAKDFDQYLELVALDPDKGLLSWALSWVVEIPDLTADQFRALAVHPLVAT